MPSLRPRTPRPLLPVRAAPTPAYPTLGVHRARRARRRRRWVRPLAAAGLAAALALPFAGCRYRGLPIAAHPPIGNRADLENQANLISYRSSLRIETNPPNQVGRCQIMSAAEMEAVRRSERGIEFGAPGETLRRWTPFRIEEVPSGHAVHLRLEILHQGQAHAAARFVPFRPGRETVITWDVTENPEARWVIEYR